MSDGADPITGDGMCSPAREKRAVVEKVVAMLSKFNLADQHNMLVRIAYDAHAECLWCHGIGGECVKCGGTGRMRAWVYRAVTPSGLVEA